MHSNNVALLVHSCDRYKFLFPGFGYFFSKYWDFEIPCNYYFATEMEMAEIKGFQSITSGEGPWADRLRFLLADQVQEKYILYFQEDMWLNKKVNKEFFTELFRLVEEKGWKQVKLHSSGVYTTSPTPYYIQGFNVAKIDNERSGYLMSHQVTLWEKDFLIKQLHKKEHPWRNERKGTKRLRALDPEIYHVDYFAENGHGEINQNTNPVGRSEYQAVSMNALLHQNVIPYIEELREGGKDAYASALEDHYRNNLTHDGKPKPRKQDVFKRMKEYFKSLK